MLFRKPKLKDVYDEKLVTLIQSTKFDLQQTKVVEDLLDDYDADLLIQRQIAESLYFYLFKEAKIRKVNIR